MQFFINRSFSAMNVSQDSVATYARRGEVFNNNNNNNNHLTAYFPG